MVETTPHIEPLFLDSTHGRLFCIYLRPRDREPAQTILYLHPFAEEMHKSRRMAALQARALAAAGYAVLQPDLTGCGDSDGDFGTADWSLWREDARLALAWLAQRHPVPHSLWGLRLGASLAAELAHEPLAIERLILWQPIISGELFLNQFLRIQLASEMLSTGETQSGTKQLRTRLDAGETLEIGGYALAPAMAQALAIWKLADHTPTCRTDWFDIGDGGSLAPASQRVVDAWRAAGVRLDSHSVTGNAFWITQEISECPELILATLRTLTA